MISTCLKLARFSRMDGERTDVLQFEMAPCDYCTVTYCGRQKYVNMFTSICLLDCSCLVVRGTCAPIASIRRWQWRLCSIAVTGPDAAVYADGPASHVCLHVRGRPVAPRRRGAPDALHAIPSYIFLLPPGGRAGAHQLLTLH